MENPPHNPLTPTRALNSTAHWYYQAFVVLSTHLRRAPSIDEFATYLGRSTSVAWRALSQLVAAGYLVKVRRRFTLPPSKAEK